MFGCSPSAREWWCWRWWTFPTVPSHHRFVLVETRAFSSEKRRNQRLRILKVFSVKNREKREEERRWKKKLIKQTFENGAREMCVRVSVCSSSKERAKSGKENYIMINSSHRFSSTDMRKKWKIFTWCKASITQTRPCHAHSVGGLANALRHPSLVRLISCDSEETVN